MKTFNPQELSECDNREGRPVHIAYRGRIFDVSQSRFWKTGLHMKRHRAGLELRAEIGAAPHSEEVLERFPEMGSLSAEATPERPLPAFLSFIGWRGASLTFPQAPHRKES